jgi:hypothetical protein
MLLMLLASSDDSCFMVSSAECTGQRNHEMVTANSAGIPLKGIFMMPFAQSKLFLPSSHKPYRPAPVQG